MKFTKYILIAAVGLAGITQSCTDLEPEVYSDVLKKDYYKTPEQFATLLANAYAQLAGEYGYVYREGYWSMQQCTSDEVMVPTRGTEWADNGVPLAMHKHTWEVNTRDVNNGWSFAYGGVTKCNEVLNNIKMIMGDDESAYNNVTKTGIAETKVLRAFYHLLAMDLYGNVAIVPSDTAKPKQSSRAEVFAFIEKEIKDNLSLLQPTVSYGRVTKSVAQMMLAKLYLNAEVYSGTTRWPEAAAMCDSIINGGYGYALDADYFGPFKVNNVNNKEIIFPIVFDAVYAKGNMFHLMSLHYAHQDKYGFTTPPWNGPCTLPAFYNSYSNDDKRKAQWLTGPITDANGNTINFVKGSVRKPAIIVADVTTESDPTEQNTFEGARFVKFEIEPGIGHHANSDFPVYRYADVLLMKAEALMRMNGGGIAQSDLDATVNQLIPRTAGSHTVVGYPSQNFAGIAPYTTGTFNYDMLLAERGRELAWEGHRRQDLIRFEKFDKAWGFKDASPTTRSIFPIPQWVMDAAPGVYIQNPGY